MLRACMPCVREPVRACSRMPCGRAGGGDVGAQPDWALGLTLIRQVLIRQVENIGPPDLDLHSYSLGRTLYPVLDCPCDRYVLV